MLGQTGETQTMLSPAPISVWTISIIAFIPPEVTASLSGSIVMP